MSCAGCQHNRAQPQALPVCACLRAAQLELAPSDPFLHLVGNFYFLNPPCPFLFLRSENRLGQVGFRCSIDVVLSSLARILAVASCSRTNPAPSPGFTISFIAARFPLLAFPFFPLFSLCSLWPSGTFHSLANTAISTVGRPVPLPHFPLFFVLLIGLGFGAPSSLPFALFSLPLHFPRLAI